MSTNNDTATTNADVRATSATKRVTAELGTVISGTMRHEDLIPAFMDRLDDLKQDLALSAADTQNAGCELEITRQVGAIDDFLGAIEQRMEAEGYYSSEQSDYDLEELFERLENFAPDGCYFGAHPGDGADYGFWQGEFAKEGDSGGDPEGDGEVAMEGDPGALSCGQCQMLSINGVACHEQGCPNQGKVYEGGAWVKYYECRECGSDVRDGDSCDCMGVSE